MPRSIGIVVSLDGVRFARGLRGRTQLSFRGYVHVHVPQQSVIEVVYESVDGELLPALPRIPNDRSLTNVHTLLDDIELAQPAMPLLQTQYVELGLMFPTYVL